MLLRDSYLQELISVFQSVNYDFEVWAYGSRVSGNAHSGSDLDLVIRSSTLHPVPIKILSRLIDRIGDSNIPILVELRDWARIPEEFRQNILQNYEVIYKSGSPAYYKT